MKHLKTFEAMFDFLKKSKPTQPAKKEEVVPVKSTNPNHQLHQDREVFDYGISDFAKFVKFCKEKNIYDLILVAADKDKVLLGDNMKNETDWKESFLDLDGNFNIIFTGSSRKNDEIWYARVDACNATEYPLAVYDEELKKYLEHGMPSWMY